MIVTEYYATRQDGVRLLKTYSDEGFQIVQNETGVVYDEAIDVENASWTYSESAEQIEYPEIENMADVAKAMLQNRYMNIINEDNEDPDYFDENEPETDYFQ